MTRTCLMLLALPFVPWRVAILNAQNANPRAIRLAVADYVKSETVTKGPLYAGKRVVFDTSRLAYSYDGRRTQGNMTLGQPDTRDPVARSNGELSEFAQRLGTRIAITGDIPICDQGPGRAPNNCRPKDVVAVQIGEPTFGHDTAFVVVRLSTVTGETRLTVYRNRTIAVLLNGPTGWRVAKMLGSLVPR